MPKSFSAKVQPYVGAKDFVLDLCCGVCNVTRHLKFRKMVCVDIFDGYINKVLEDKAFKSKDALLLQSDALEFVDHCIENGHVFDVVLCLDGVEHLEESRALELLGKMPKCAKKRVVVFTPDRLVKNTPKDTWGVKGGDLFQHHISLIEEAWFIKNGWEKVYTMRKAANLYGSGPHCSNLYISELIPGQLT